MKRVKLMMMTLVMCLFITSCVDSRLKEISDNVSGKTFVFMDNERFLDGNYAVIKFNNDNTCDVTQYINGKIDHEMSCKSEPYEFHKVSKSYEAMIGYVSLVALGDGFYCSDGIVTTKDDFDKNWYPTILVSND